MSTQEWILILAPVIIIQLSLAICALYDLWKRQGTANISGMSPRTATIVWILIILVVNFFGPIAYFLLGRKEEVAEDDRD